MTSMRASDSDKPVRGISLRSILASAAVVIASTAIALFLAEIAARTIDGRLTEWRNYATDPINLTSTFDLLQFDPYLGWSLKPNHQDRGFGPYGNRMHKRAPDERGAPILAVGDSFTFGSEVLPDETWPAYLEQDLHRRVINAGVGGYGVDQIVMNAEKLAPIVNPALILLSFIPPDIDRVKMSVFSGANKPVFHVGKDGGAVAVNLPLSPYRASSSHVGFARAVLGYSYLIEWTAQRLGFANMWHSSKFEYRYDSDVDPIAVSCALMEPLAKLGPPVIIVAQHGAGDFTPAGKTGLDQQGKILDCAKDAGIRVIDTLASFRGQLPETYDAPSYGRFYVGGQGHMTAAGNALVARTIADAIKQE